MTRYASFTRLSKRSFASSTEEKDEQILVLGNIEWSGSGRALDARSLTASSKKGDACDLIRVKIRSNGCLNSLEALVDLRHAGKSSSALRRMFRTDAFSLCKVSK